MEIEKLIENMPKIELHVHLEGSVRTEILLSLAAKNNILLPASTVEELNEWYLFKDFNHFIEVYFKISECICSVDDIEMITREFLRGQAQQNIIYSEITYTAYTHYLQKSISFADQIGALERAKNWGEKELAISCNFILDIARNVTAQVGLQNVRWIKEVNSDAVVGLGLGGPEAGYPPELHEAAFKEIAGTKLKPVPHAGETVGPESVWGAIKYLHAFRIGHGIRSIEDPALIRYLRDNKIVLEICPTSNICLGIYPGLEMHPLPLLVDEDLLVTINSDDPPMFNTSLTMEYKKIARQFNFTGTDFYRFNKTALENSLMNQTDYEFISNKFEKEWAIINSIS